MRITKEMRQNQDDQQIEKWEFIKYHLTHRYDYYAIDEYRQDGKMKDTYKTKLSLKEGFNLVEALLHA